MTSVLTDAYHLTATATNSAGHASAPSAALDVTIDTHAPVTPKISVYSEAGSVIGSTTTLDDLVLKGTAEANSTIKVFDGSTEIGIATANGSGTWSFDTGHLDVGPQLHVQGIRCRWQHWLCFGLGQRWHHRAADECADGGY